MKKLLSLLTLLTLTLVTFNMRAQAYQDGIYHKVDWERLTHYSGSVGVNMGGIINTDGEGSPFTLAILTEQGILTTAPTWDASIFFGGATGLDVWTKNTDGFTYTQLGVPVYLTMKALFNKSGNIQPYIKAKAGWEGFFYQRYSYNGDSYSTTTLQNTMLTGGGFGVSIPINKKYAIEVGIEYTLNLETEDNYSLHRLGGVVQFTF